jgi:EAL domain-containing protein (putative c-di-GMP-specific phosphodiesterase class I)
MSWWVDTFTDTYEAIVAGIIGMGRALGLDVVAEGVETDLQAARLIDVGCKRAQGYLFGYPVPVGDLLSLRSLPCTWWG